MKKNIYLILFFILIIVTIFILIIFTNKKENNISKEKSKDNIYKITTNTIKEDNMIIETVPVETEDELVNYLKNIDDKISELNSTTNIKSTLKNTFITLTDFIFYDGTIRGKKFSDLTDDAKEKIISLWKSIDTKIESLNPGYKEEITETTNKAYETLSETATSIMNSIKNKYKEKVGEEEYNSTINQLNDQKGNITNSYNNIKEKVKDVYKEKKSNISDWYQNYKESSD